MYEKVIRARPERGDERNERRGRPARAVRAGASSGRNHKYSSSHDSLIGCCPVPVFSATAPHEAHNFTSRGRQTGYQSGTLAGANGWFEVKECHK